MAGSALISHVHSKVIMYGVASLTRALGLARSCTCHPVGNQL